jgi:formylglycine-generating enzyme required for sulfatase activity
MADPSLLAEALTILLTQSLPYLLAGGKKVAGKAVEEIGKQVGAGASEQVKAIWKRLRGKRPIAAAAKDLAQLPDDSDAQGALRLQLKKLLAADPALADEIAALYEAARPHLAFIQAQGEAVVAAQGAVAAREVAVGRDVHGNVVIINPGFGPVDAAQVLRWLDQARPSRDREEATRLYLEHLVERHRFLDLRGMGVSDRVPLRLPLLEMYIPLTARVETPEGETWHRVAGRMLAEEETAAVGHRLSEPQSVLGLLQSHGGVVLLGDPGAGKTTFLKFLALTLATGQGEAVGLGERVPVLVPLSAYADALTKAEISLQAFIPRYYSERGIDLALGEVLESALRQGRALLLLDGLDEVRELGQRHRIVERVKDFYCFHKKAGNKLAVTSRIIGYREARLEAPDLAEATLVDFEEEEIEAFIEKWTSALERAASGETRTAEIDAEREKAGLLDAVRRSAGVRDLAANPLLLTILALMKRQGVDLPERRVELYETYVKTLLRHWNLARSLDGRAAREVDDVETLKSLAPLALWMQETSPGRGLVKEWDLRQKLETIFQGLGHPKPQESTRLFLADVRDHAALLLDRGGRQYGFIHLTFQEYLAAVALAQRGQQDVGPVVEALARHIEEPAWYEVSLLTVGYMGIVQKRDEAASSVLTGLLDQAPGPPGLAVTLAGRAVVDVGAAGVTRPLRSRVIEALLHTMRSGNVEPRRRAEAGRILAELGDPRPEVTKVDAMEFCRVPAGPFWMGSDEKGSEKPAHENEISYDYFIGRYPVTLAQFQEYLRDSERQPEDPDSLRGAQNAPVVWISWNEALAFCDWLTLRWRKNGWIEEGWKVGLPSEAEWEKAARGGIEIPVKPGIGSVQQLPGLSDLVRNPMPTRRYPWGEGAEPGRVNCRETQIGRPSSLGCFPAGASPYGGEEMSGNVWEWTRSLWGDESHGNPSSPSPRVLRGGSFGEVSADVRCAVRYRRRPTLLNGVVGFRLLLSPFFSEL